MKLSSVLTRSTSFVKKLRFILFFYLGFLSTDLGAHGTQVEYCFTNNNMVRVYIEHWHGNVTDFSQSIVNMTITADGVATTMNVPASGFVHDTPQGMLPDCSAPTIQISECTNVADVYNDWAYFDFPAPECFQSLVIRINSVTDPTFVLLECGASRGGPIYPASTPVITRTDEFAPFIVCEDELPDLILGCNDVIPIPQEIRTIDVTDDCTDSEDIILTVSEVDGTMSCTGNGIIRTYTFTDDDDKSTECEQQISYADDSTPPRIMCPADLRLACDDPNAESTISDWLETYRTSDDCSTNINVTNTYSESGFAYQDVGPSLMTGGVLNLGSFMMPAVTKSIVDNYLSQGRSEAFLIKETSNKNQYDKLIKTRLYYQEGMAIDFSDVLIVDEENRVLPIGISELEPGVSMEIIMKVPELKAGQDNSFKVLYGKCHGIDVTMDSSYDLGDDRSHLIISPILSNIFSEKKEDTEQKSKAIEAPAVVMGCNCTASQGGVSFPINAIQNPRDDVEFYIFGNNGTSQAASSNTGFECNDQVVMFLYENTLTGEISLFVIIDAARGGNGGSGSIDFFCLPATATVDHSDDNGEITGLFPTVMANWRWADCCTDGAVIGNVGCDQTFDFVPQFVSGINSIKWVSGTPTAPVFNTFPNITDPIRISCGDSNPSCCPNTNQVSITNATCPSDNDGSINVTPDPAGGPYAFEWSTGATTEDISNLSPGDYTVTILDDNDCEQITTFTVDVETKPDLICDADQVVLMGGTRVTLEEGINVMYTLDYNCADDTKIDCSGCGDFDCDDQNSIQLITLTVSDELGNTDQCTINVTIQNTAPDIVCPSDLTIGCIDPAGEDLIETWITTARVRDPEGGLTVVDNTYDDSSFSFTDEDGPQKVSGKQSIQSEPKDYYLRLVESYSMMMPIPSSGSQTVTFTATDACGNTSTCTADIIIVDNTDPIIDCPSDITVECGDPNNDAIIVNWLDNASADDTCDESFIDITNNFTALSTNACGGETTVTFTATDSAGNRAQCRSTITHEDTTPPEFLMKPQNLVAECINSNGAQPEINAWAAAMGNGMAIDDCDSDVRWSFVIDGQEETCGHTYIRTYTFTITDNCGNTASSTATATVVDETPPVLNLRADITVNCSAANPTQLMTFIDAFGSTSDLCTDGENILVENVLFNTISGCGGTSTETYLFTATDECGNATTGFWNFTIQDIAIPTWVNPPGTLFLECGDEDNPTLIQEWLADVEASTVDACGAVHTVTNNWDGNLPDDNCNSNTAVTFTVVDDCGNVRTNLVRSIRVRDLTNPVIVNCPEDFTVNVDVDNCSSNVVFSTPVGFDQCTDIVTINQTIGPASGSEFPVGTTRIVFEAIDDCGRRSNPDCDFNITVVDSDTPSVSCPSNVDACVPAGSCTWRSDDTVLPMSADNCDRVVIQVEITGATTLTRRTGTAANRIFQLGTSTVCYYVTDAAGNESTCCFDVVVTDCTAPTIMCPADITVACEESTSTTGPSGNLVYDHNQNAGQSYAAANNIGSVISSANDITFGPGLQLLDDGFNPAVIPNGSTFEHILTGAATTTFTAAEAADDYVEICFSTSCAGVITQMQQGIIPGPDGSAAGNYMVAAAISNDGFLSSSILYQDAFLPDPNITNSYALYQEPLDFALAAGQTYKIRYYLYNEQNNITPNTTVAFDDLFIDITKIIETGNGAALTDWLGDVSASDNCPGGVTITSSLFNTISGCGDANSNVYEFTAVDVDGNTSTCQSSFTIEDTIAPEITTAATNGDSDCENANADLLDWLNNFGFAEANDACGDITWSHDFEGGAMTGCSGVTALMVTFTATDDCGNTATTQANFEVNDAEAPTLTCPVDITLECGDVLNEAVTELWLQSAVASDNCTAVDITNNYPTDFVADCGSTGATTVTFTATDGCDNGERCEATIVIEDSTAPVLLVAPQDLVVECGPSAVSPTDWLESNGGAVATDQCDAALVWTVAIGSTTPGCGDSQMTEYIFTVTDVCGNATSASALYIFEDTLLPTVVPPADITVECGVITTSVTEWQEGAKADDDCGSGFTFEAILFNTVSGCGESMTEVYQFTATDACGNQATALASYTIVDTTEPRVSCPSVLALECGSELNDLLIIEWLDSPEGVDGCGDVTFEDNYAGTLPVNCGGRLQVLFTGIDACGNEATCTSSITMDDTGLPDFVNCPDDLTINVDVDECGSNPIFSTPVAVDNCSVTVEQTEGIASGNTFPVGTTAIEFTATDECGNTALCQFDLSVEDSDVPLVLCPSNTVVACADKGLCIWSSVDVGPTLGLENCENSTLVYTIIGTTSGSGADDASGTLFALGTSTICYTLTDASGNASSCCFDVLVEDCQAPGLTCPADLVVECDGLGNASDVSAFLAGASGADNCQDQPVITNELFNAVSECGGGETTVYQFTATDEAGNTTLCTASMSIIDRVIPELTTPAVDLTVECAGGAENNSAFLAWLNNNGGATATDVCSDIVWSHNFTEELTDLCGSTGARTVTFTARDACGNPIMTTAVFRISDSEDPMLVCPQPIVLECNDPANEAIISNWFASASATDACSEVEIAYVFPDVFTTDCGDTGEHTVTFEAADECGNDTNCVSTIRLEDNINPVFDLRPSNLMLECADPNNANLVSIWLANNGGGIASDLCSTPVWMFEEISEIPSCGSTSETVFLFTITDDCNNTNTAFASVITENTTPPILATPTELTVECDGSNNLMELNDWLALADGSSDCGSLIIENQLFNTISDCGGSSEQVYLFTATDQCGNQSTALSSFIIEDTTDPTPVCPPTLVLECGDEGNDQAIAAWLLSTDITDVSGCSEVILSNNYNGNLPTLLCSGNPGTIVQFTATDDCGNSQSCQSLITINDTTAPLFANCPTDITVNVDVDLCSSNVVYSQPVAMDQCDLDVDIALTSGLASGTTFPLGTTPILFTAMDACGNATTCTFNITVEDSDIPEIDCPSNRVVVCTTDGTCMWEANEETSAVFSENCEGAGFTVTYAITGTTTANSSSTGLNDVDSDNVIFNLGVSEVCYMISDEAGNSDQCCFDLVVEDCQDPEIVCPADLVVECDGVGNGTELVDWLASVTGTDNCDTSVELSFQMFNTISGCGDTQSEIYAFTAVDDFGNSTTCYAEFAIEDTSSPSIDVVAVNLTVECSGAGNSTALTAWLNDAGGAEASDLCGEITWTHNFTGDLITTCNGASSVAVVFTAIDDCGNESSTSAVFTIEDTVDPLLICPEPIELECNNTLNEAIITNWLTTATSTDVCSEVVVTNTYPDVYVQGCGDTGRHTVTFTSIDACGNETTCLSTITIIDNLIPEFELSPADLVLECADVNNATLIAEWLANNGGGIGIDQCSAVAWEAAAQPSIQGCGSTSETPYLFTITDACGNTNTATAIVVIENTTPPVIVPPNPLTVECDGAGNLAELNNWLMTVSGSSDCGEVVLASQLFNTISGCGGADEQVYVFTASDECGNQSTAISSFLIEDTTVPTPLCPEDILLECGAEGNDQAIAAWLLSAGATDEVGCSAVVVTHNHDANLPGSCATDSGATVEFTATDACGNTATCTAVITIEDTTAPLFSNCPIDLTVNVDVDLCTNNVIYSQPLALDDCDNNVEVALTNGIPSGATFPLGTTALEFTATDDCGNTSLCEFSITVLDSDVPSIECPSNEVVVCTDTDLCTWEATSVSSSSFADNCAVQEGYTVTYTVTGATTATSPTTGINDVDEDDVVFNLGTSEICYTITDAAGNSDQCCFDLVVEDCQDPEIVCPADFVVECDGTGNSTELATWLGSVGGSDNCASEVELTNRLFNTISGCGETQSEIYAFTVTDDFGNTSLCYAEFRIEDTTVPTIDVEAADLTLECNGTGSSAALTAWLNYQAGAMASDLCGEISWSHNFVQELDVICDGNSTTTVTFTATDNCGNESTTTAVFTIEDTVVPVVVCPEDITLECAGELNDELIANWLDRASATDECSTVTLVDDFGNVFTGACGSTGVHTVTFTATDGCNNLSACESTVTIVDESSPQVISAPIDLVLECSSSDNATEISNWEMNFGGAVATDPCSEPLVWSIVARLTFNDCGNTSKTEYTFQVEDACGNLSTTSASVIIEDTTPPELIVPSDQLEECNSIAVPLSDWREEVTGSDTCGEVTFTSVLWNTTSGCGGTESMTYLFTATDACGNSTTGFADYSIEDTTVPEINCPENLALVCGNEANDQIIANWLNSASSSDPNNCSAVEITNDLLGGLPILDCNDGAGIEITFSAIDECNNLSTCSSTITMDDTEAPFFSNCPADLTVNVDVDLCVTNVVYSQPLALDDCDNNVEVALTNGIPSGATFPLGTTALEFTATDDCGNTSLCEFSITVLDSDVPSIECPSNEVVVCTDTDLCTWEATGVSSSSFADNCAEQEGYTVTYTVTGATTATSPTTGINDVDEDDVVFNLGTSEICYTIADAAGNSDQCCFDLVVEDCQDPEIVCPADLVVECDSAGNNTELATWLGSVGGSDNCASEVELTNRLFNTISGCGETQSEIYAFTVTDDFGNTSLCYAEFRIEDTTVPTIDVEAADLTLECNGTGSSAALTAWLNYQEGAMASDLCGEISWSHNFVQELDVICDGNSTTTVTFTATDNCGNESTTTAVFTIEDTVDPFIVCPEDITLECAGELNDELIANWLDRASAEDGCSGVTLVNNFGELFAAGCGSTGVHNVIFTAEDACNNLSVCEGNVTIVDESSPEIVSEPIDLILECAGTDNATDISNWETSFGGAVATDACSSPLIWTIISTSSLDDCGSTSSSEYTFQVTDDCGNTSTTTASVIIEDTTPPELVVPEDQVEECNAIAVSLEEWRAEVTGSDACGAVAFTSVLWNTTSGCGGTESMTYLFTATDACGNSSTGFASYGTEDTQVPTPVCPANLLLTCGSVSNDQQILSWLNSASATDAVDCSELNITNDYPGDLPELNCNGGLGIEINFIATDACGNSSSCSSTITMDDNTPPTFSNCPLDMMVNVDVDLCSTNVVYSQPIALDACDAFVEVALIEGVPSGMPFPLGLTTVTFESIDECGNTSICTFDITVVDSDVPSIACPSNDVVVCTDSNTCAWIATDQIDPIYNDNCPDQILTYNITGATTAMSGPTGVNEVDAGGEIFILGRSTILYTITDPEGNVGSCEFDVVVEDCEDPTLTCVDVTEVACGSEDLSVWFNTIAASIMDNCSAAGEMVVDTLLLTDFSSCGNTFDRVYQYRVTDAFGNFSQCIARYETIDEVVPDITDATDLTVECADGSQSTALLAWLNDNGGATATDACSTPITWTNDFVNDLSIVCGSNGRVEVVFTATDACGNFSTTSAVFTIEDTTAPVLTCPDDISLECSEDINVAVINNWLRTATALDACQGITDIVNNYPGLFAEGCGLTGVHTVTFATSDDCGSLSSCQREIRFLDRIAPEIIREAEDLELSCSSTTSAEDIALWLANNAGAEATDACSDEALVWTFEEIESSEGCGGFSNQTYVFTVTDNCGNTSTTEAMVVISDDTDPDFDLGPQDLTINCDPMANAVSLEDWLTSNGGAIASDECASNFTWTYDLVSLSDDCGNTSVQTYRFTVSDECGNSSTAEADFVTTDAVAPVITKEAENFTAECNGSSNSAEILSWLNNNGFATAEDLCGSITWTNDYGTVLTDCGTAGGVTVIFTATDECGNSSTTSAVFTINDTTDPIWTLNPQSIEVECDGSNDPMGQIEAWLNTAGGGEAEDDCSAISYTHNFSAIDLECDMEGGVEVMFTVTDACGNFSTATAMLTITDDVPPIFTIQAANQSVECNGSGNLAELQAWLDANGGAVAQDGCSADLTWAYVMRATIGNCGMTQIATYDFTATDACGNVSANTTAAFIIEDTTMPVFDRVPTNLVVECDGVGNRDQLVAWLDDNGTGLASDICGAVSWTWDLVTEQDKCGDTGDQVYRFTLTDACGNTNTAEATFTIEDTTIPVLIAGTDELLEDCSDDFNGDILQFDAWLTNNAGATASDICGQITWSNDYVFENWVTTCGNTQYVDVTFTATDNCGNSDSTTHRFGVGDISAPTFVNCPRPPVVVDAPDTWCSAFVNFAEPVAEDNCSDFTIEQVDNTGLGSGDLFDVGLTILSYVATDQCGNTSTCELKIIVNDFHTPPSITCGGSMTVYNDPSMCGAIVDGIAPLTLDDNCLANLSVVYEVLDAAGILIYSGFDDASGLKFPTGANSISYTVTDQPLLLITELVQDGVSSGVEIANFGPGSLDISCLDISRIGNSEETFNVPNGTVLPVGGIYTQAFSQINPAASAGYYISFLDKIIDGVSINGYVSSIYDFGGSIFGENVYRNQVSDRDGAVDFVVADACFTGSYGEFNPSLPVMPDNGIGSSLQQAVPSTSSCFFNVIVVDNEPAFCAAFDTTRYCLTSELIAPNTCTQYTFDVPGGITVGEINLRDLIVTHNQVGDLGFSLTSPAGTTVQLFDALCAGTSNVDISLDDQSSTALTSVSCEPLGGAASYQAFESLSAFFDEPAAGSWTLNVYNNGNEEGALESICLEILELRPYTQGDLVLSNDLGECSAAHTWQHPQIDENCGMASMTITFESDQNIALPPSGDVVPGEMTTEIFAVGTTRVIYTIEDAAGNKSICSFEVIVVDDEEPIIDLAFCQNQTIQLGPGECFVPVSALNLPPIIENCGSSNISFTPAIDAGLPSGDHPLVFALVDAFGNSSGCDFMVTVLPFEVPNGQLACLGQINLSLGADCEEQITADMILGPGQVVGCTEDYCVTVRDEDGNEVAGGVVNETHIGQVVIVEVCPDCNGGNCCWGEVLVEKKVTSIACPVSQISISCNQVFEPAVVGEPIVETCEQDLLFSYEDNFILGDMCDTAPGTIERTWYITDQNNNVQQCLQVITIVGFDINEVNFPADTILTTDLITCEDIAVDEDLLHPDHTGWPDLNGVAINITGDGLCSHFWGWEDTKLYNCEGSYEILRQWLVRDMCDPVDFGTNPIIYYQSIKVLDNMPPQFTGCDHGTIAAPANFDCNTEIYLNDYFPEITDLCGSVKDTLITVTPGAAIERPVGSGQYYLTNMAPGTHTVKITVGDHCSNINRCEFDINVIDQTGPNVACEQDVHVSLNSVGLTEFPAEILDDGSFDNCTAVEFQVYRMDDNCGNPSDLEPGAYVSLCCADVTASPINLMLRVWDDADNNGMFGTTGDFFSECMVRVNVSNATTPSLSCPPSIELACNADYTNLNLTGQPTLGSACNFVDAEFADDISALNSCNTGEVIRTWNIIGQNIECEQVIHIESAMPFTENDIVWPQNVEGDCSVMTTAHQPLVSTLSCSQIGIDVASDTFFFTENACYQVINEWTVIDWCQYDGTTTLPQGIWEHTQTITVTSTEAPVITGCGDLIVDLENDDCSALDVPVSNTATSNGCASGSDLSWSYEIDYDADGNSDMNGITSGAVSNITLMEVDELGATILWTAIDGCGNTDACTQFVTVRDGKNPLAYCNSIAVATMEVNGAVEVWVSDVDAGSTDNCTATSDLVLSFDAATTVSNVSFSCADIPNGISEDIQVTLFITDEAGNQSNCTTTISLQDNADACPDQVQTPIMIAGIIKTEDGVPLQAVQTQIVDGAMLVEEMNVTDTTGGFEFTDVQINGNYRITPTKSGGFLDGLSTFDLILIQRHILGAAILDSPYKIIAADVTRNDKVNGQDLIELRKLLLTHIDSFATGDSWRFVPENFVFQNPTSPFPIEEDIVISSVQDSMMHNDFIGVKLGDVDGSFVVNLDDQELSTRSIYNIHYTVESNEEASTYLMPVFSTDLDVIYGFQLGLQLNQGQVLDILPGSVTLKEENYKMLDAQTIAISWNEVEGSVTNLNAPLFYLKVADIDVASFEIELLTEMPQAEIYLTESLTTKVPVLSLYEEVDEEQDFELYQNDPNPFKDWTTIDFYLPTAQDVTMSFYTPDGALIHSVKGRYPEGRSSLKIEASDLGAQNVIIYRLSSDLYTSGKKMILVK